MSLKEKSFTSIEDLLTKEPAKSNSELLKEKQNMYSQNVFIYIVLIFTIMNMKFLIGCSLYAISSSIE